MRAKAKDRWEVTVSQAATDQREGLVSRDKYKRREQRVGEQHRKQ